MGMIYLDYNATTPVHPHVADLMDRVTRDVFGNPSSVHAAGAAAKKILENAREQVGLALGRDPEDILFTSGGTEANNLALRGVVGRVAGRKPHLVSTGIEHKSVLETLDSLASEGLATVTRVSAGRDGRVSVASVEQALTPETVLVSVMEVNNETGVIQPTEEIGLLLQKKRIFFHTDAVQALGKGDVSKSNADLLSLSAHKIGGPKGVGVLCVRPGFPLKRLLTGGAQEGERRGGTENVAGIAGFAEALRLLTPESVEAENKRLCALRDRLEAGLLKISGTVVHGTREHRVANTCHVSFAGVDSEISLVALDRAGVAVSSGSACASGALEPSHVLLAMGVERGQAKGAVRFSLGRLTTGEEIDKVLRILPEVIERLRA